MYNKIKFLAALTIFLALLAAGMATVRADDSFSEPATDSPTNPIKGEVVESRIITSDPVIGPSGLTAVAQGEVVESTILSAPAVEALQGGTGTQSRG